MEMALLVPRGALQHMFPPGKQVQSLERIAIHVLDGDRRSNWCVDSKDIASIISCCPGLQSLELRDTVKPGDLSVLQQLPLSCTKLQLSGAAFTDKAAAAVGQLQQLEYLYWGDADLTDAGLKQLAGLNVRTLVLEGCWNMSEITHKGRLGLSRSSSGVSAAEPKQTLLLQ